MAGRLDEQWAAQPWHLTAWRNSGDPKFVFGLDDLRIRDANPAAGALLDASLDTLEGQPISRVLDAPYMVRLREAVEAGCLDEAASGHTLLAIESEPARTYAVSIIPAGVEGLYLCRLARGPAIEADLRRLNWALAAYARSSAALIRAASFKDLVTGVCGAIVGEDDYLAATVGLAEQGPRPAGAHGGRRRVGDGLSAGSGPELVGGCAWGPRARRPLPALGPAVLMKDSRKEPTCPLWRRKAMDVGVRCAVALPFGRDDQPAGVLVVYAGEPDAFGEREIDLFSRLSRELAFALSVEEDRIQLRAAEEARKAAEEAAQEASPSWRAPRA
ncbi:MAG: GAF domain-containing protein [Caulobacteraceae bacterium]